MKAISTGPDRRRDGARLGDDQDRGDAGEEAAQRERDRDHPVRTDAEHARRREVLGRGAHLRRRPSCGRGRARAPRGAPASRTIVIRSSCGNGHRADRDRLVEIAPETSTVFVTRAEDHLREVLQSVAERERRHEQHRRVGAAERSERDPLEPDARRHRRSGPTPKISDRPAGVDQQEHARRRRS